MDDGLWMEEFAYHYVELLPEKESRSHVQDAFFLFYVKKGRGIRRFGNQTATFSSGEVFLISPLVPHKLDFDSTDTTRDGKVQCVLVFLMRPFLENVAGNFVEFRDAVDRLLALRGVVVFNAGLAKKIIKVLNVMRESDSRKIGSVLDLLSLVSNYTQDSVIEVVRKPEESRFMDQVRAFLDAHIMEGIKKEDLAHHMGMSSVSFDLKIRRYSGKNFSSYLNEYRLRHAVQLLTKERMPIAEICYLSGFNSISHFNHLFKEYTGHTPSEFRQGGSSLENMSAING